MKKRLSAQLPCAVFFDSGIGGLNLLCACAKKMPAIRYIYCADNANVPYGNKSDEEIYRLTREALGGIEKLNPRALVIACNTVTARCIDRLRETYPFPVVGIQPAIKQAAAIGGRCLVLATASTVNSRAFASLCSRFKEVEPIIYACKDLAGYIENNIENLPEKLPAGLLPEVEADSVVLGCTHYVYVKKQIKSFYNRPVFDGISGTANHFVKIIGMTDHFRDFFGNNDHKSDFAVDLTFLRGNIDKNGRIFDDIYYNNE